MKQRKRNFKATIQTVKMTNEDRTVLVGLFKHIKHLSSLAKKTKNKEAQAIFQKEIAECRNVHREYAHEYYRTTIAIGPHKKASNFIDYPFSTDLVFLKNDLMEGLSKNRKDRKIFNEVYREFNGLPYRMMGPPDKESEGLFRPRDIPVAVMPGEPEKKKDNKKDTSHILPGLKGGGRVFKEEGSIVKFLTSQEYARRITKAKLPYDKSQYVGVELELICSVDRNRLNEIFVKNKLAGMVYVKHDGSIQQEKNNEFTHEVTILGKQQHIMDIVTRACAVLNSKEVDAYVNNSCGLHVHIDMRNRNAEQCYEKFYKSLPVLAAMVPANRTMGDHAARYCAMNKNPKFDPGSSRYQALNAHAFQTHKTLELRLHSGSTNATKINNFINLLLKIVDTEHEVVKGKDQVKDVDTLKAMFNLDDKLCEYINKRIEKFKDNRIDTKVDHFEQAI